MTEHAINWTCLARLQAAVGSDAGPIIEEVIEAFLEDLPIRVAALRRASSTRDSAAVRRWAHALKGSCVTVGADDLAAIFQSIDEAPDRAEAPLADLDEAIDQARNGLADWRRALASPP